MLTDSWTGKNFIYHFLELLVLGAKWSGFEKATNLALDIDDVYATGDG